jgi:uncharacterized protein (DUF1015 family)
MGQRDPQALKVLPFRGLRFAPDRVRDPAAVTSPPYDMIGPDEARRLADTEEHNVVRLILAAPEELAGGPGAPARYHRAAASLRAWIGDGALRQDAEPAFYVYEQAGPGFQQRGLIALARLDDAILPHEAVTDSVVADRLAQMRATDAHLEPILLTYGGDRTVSELLDHIADQAEPLTETTTADGTRHRLWALADDAAAERVAGALHRHRALIADGHHRHAAYRLLAAERRAERAAEGRAEGWTGGRTGRGDERGDGPADYGLALLVDATHHPLSLHAIHRVLPHVPLDTAMARARKVFTVTETPDPHHALDPIAEGEHAFVLSDGTTHYLLTSPDPAFLAETIPADRPEAWRALDATVLHHVLVEAIWQLPDTPEEVRFDHDPRHAVAEAARIGGTAVLLRPTTEDVVRELAAAGVLMPRKSTAFGPKPATGLVMRLLADDAAGSTA